MKYKKDEYTSHDFIFKISQLSSVEKILKNVDKNHLVISYFKDDFEISIIAKENHYRKELFNLKILGN